MYIPHIYPVLVTFIPLRHKTWTPQFKGAEVNFGSGLQSLVSWLQSRKGMVGWSGEKSCSYHGNQEVEGEKDQAGRKMHSTRPSPPRSASSNQALPANSTFSSEYSGWMWYSVISAMRMRGNVPNSNLPFVSAAVIKTCRRCPGSAPPHASVLCDATFIIFFLLPFFLL